MLFCLHGKHLQEKSDHQTVQSVQNFAARIVTIAVRSMII